MKKKLDSSTLYCGTATKGADLDESGKWKHSGKAGSYCQGDRARAIAKLDVSQKRQPVPDERRRQHTLALNFPSVCRSEMVPCFDIIL